MFHNRQCLLTVPIFSFPKRFLNGLYFRDETYCINRSYYKAKAYRGNHVPGTTKAYKDRKSCCCTKSYLTTEAYNGQGASELTEASIETEAGSAIKVGTNTSISDTTKA